MERLINYFDQLLDDYFVTYFFTIGFLLGWEIVFVIAIIQQWELLK